MEGANAESATLMLQRALKPYDLQRKVEANNLGARRAQWVLLDENQAVDIPI